MELVLSLFPGIDLLGRGFEAEGYCVVRGPDKIFGGDIHAFHALPGRFDGVIAGTPCQDYSTARRAPPTGDSDRAIRGIRARGH
jgi:DNA (cytosine-5)-methyltransferase 1